MDETSVDTMSNLDLPSRGLPVIITEASVCMVLCIISITGNSLVCIAAYRNPNLRSTTNLYIIALAVSDLLCATIEMPLTFTTLIIGRWDFGDTLCQIQGSVGVFANYVTSATLGLTAFNRYVKIVKTNHHNKIFLPSRSKTWLSCLWLSFILYLLIFWVTNWIRIEFNQSFAVCSFAYPTSESRIIHYCITIRLLFVLPLSVGIFSYYEIFFKIHEHKQNTVLTLQNSPSSRMNDSSVRDISVSRVFVAAGFLCCWIPMWALALWMRFSPETCPRAVQLIDVFLSYVSASVNPLIYTFTNSEFRREFRKLLRCRNERAWNASNKAISVGDKGDGLLDRRNKRRGVVGFPAVWNITPFAINGFLHLVKIAAVWLVRHFSFHASQKCPWFFSFVTDE